jgi:hypothetical protein
MDNKPYLFVVSHDAEPDDISFLRIFLSQLKHYKNSKVCILVGEGNIPQAKIRKTEDILEAAISDGILSQENRENIKVFGGSSAKLTNDFVHNFYANSFEKITIDIIVQAQHPPNIKSEPSCKHEGSSNAINSLLYCNNLVSRDELVSNIISAKHNGSKIVIFGLKPFTDLPDIIEKTKSVLNGDDYLLVSGSYNFREVKKDSVRVNSMLNDGQYNTIVFEAFTTYEKNKLPKEIMHSSHTKNGSSCLHEVSRNNSYYISISKLADSIREDKSHLGIIHKQLIDGWNRGVSYDCVADCIKPLVLILETTGIHKNAVFALKSYINALDYLFLGSYNTVAEIVLMFRNTVNKQIFAGEEILTGKERFEADYHKDFVNKFRGLDLSNFNWNWKVLCVIAEDPYEMLIGDATLAMYFWKPELFTTIKGRVSRIEDSSYTFFDENNSSNTSLITGISNYEEYVNALREGLNV